jgi:hypothetical protein
VEEIEALEDLEGVEDTEAHLEDMIVVVRMAENEGL